MAETFDDRTIINRALNRIGASGIGAIDEDTSKARQVRAVYYDRVDTVLGRYHWSFNAKTYRLDQVPEDAAHDFDTTASKFITGWRHGFYMPGTRLGGPRKVLTDPRQPDSPLREFFVEQNIIFAAVRPLWAVFGVRAHPDLWSPAMRLAIIVLLAGDFAVPITHDAALAKDLLEQGEGPRQMEGRGGLVGQAIAIDAAGTKTKAAQWSDPLGEARFG